jgi:hypothetical protein
MLPHGAVGGLDDGLGRVDAFADGLGEGHQLGPQVAVAPSWSRGHEVSGVKRGCDEVAWPEAGATPAEWRGPGAGWPEAERGARCPVPRVPGRGGPALGGAGAATATWASC